MTLFVPGLDGKVRSGLLAGQAGQVVGLVPDRGANTFPPGALISADRDRSEEGAVTLFVPGLDGKVWSAY